MATAAPAMMGWMTSLGDLTRARILRLLERRELTVAEICAVLQLPQSTVSRHLKVLGDDDWVATRREGTSRIYRAAGSELDPAARRLWLLVRDQTSETPAARQDERRLTGVLAQRQTQAQAFFSTAAGQWDRLRSELYGLRFDLQALLGLLDEQWVVADLGCGTGQVAASLAPFVKRVVGVDGSAVMLKYARQRLGGLANVDLRRGDLQSLPIEDASVDAVVVMLVLHHIADPPAVLKEAARVLKAGGRLLVVEMLRHERHDLQQQMGHVWLGFEPKQMADWFAGAGLENIRTIPLPAEENAKGPALFSASGRKVKNEK